MLTPHGLKLFCVVGLDLLSFDDLGKLLQFRHELLDSRVFVLFFDEEFFSIVVTKDREHFLGDLNCQWDLGHLVLEEGGQQAAQLLTALQNVKTQAASFIADLTAYLSELDQAIASVADTTLPAAATVVHRWTAILSTAVAAANCHIGSKLRFILTQDGTGSRTGSWNAAYKLAGGALTLTATAAKTDVIDFEYDGTSWFETNRSLNL